MGDRFCSHAQAETHWSSPGQRVFDVLFDGRIVLRHIDLVALVGANAAWQTMIARVPVSGGRLNITFQNVVRTLAPVAHACQACKPLLKSS